jgi:O-acetylhomoserine/O-acetylserine sulfhydrylase-like pyridoxal-dependent enzyme
MEPRSSTEVDGFRYTRISNPTNAVLEKRAARPR